MAKKITERLSEHYHTDISIQGVDIAFFNKIILEDILVKDQQKDSMLTIGQLVAQIDSFSIKKHQIALKDLTLNNTNIHISMDSLQTPNYHFLFERSDTVKNFWQFHCRNFAFNNADFSYSDLFAPGKKQIQLFDIGLNVSGFRLEEDSVYFHVDSLGLTDRKDFIINNFNSDFLLKDNRLYLTDLHTEMAHSVISDANILADNTDFLESGDYSKIKIDINLGQSKINMQDIAPLLPTLKGVNAALELSGRIHGTLTDLKAKRLKIKYGKNTSINCDFYMNGLPAIENTFVHFDLKKSTINFNDFHHLKLPNQFRNKYLDLPEFLYKAGQIEYQGNFTGFINDFVAYGTISSDFGQLDTDLAFKPSGTDTIGINGHLKTIDFQLGNFLREKTLGKLTYNGEIKGEYNKTTHNFIADIDGGIEHIDLNNYELNNIKLQGNISRQRFEGHLAIADDNLNFDFDGSFDFNQEMPMFNFKINMNKANLIALNIDKYFRKSALSFLLKANFKGDNIDNLTGSIWLENGEYKNENGKLCLNSFELKTTKAETENSLQLHSDYLDVNLHGNYKLHELKNSIMRIISHSFPLKNNWQLDKKDNENNFYFSGELKDISQVSAIFMPNFYIAPATFSGNINEEKNELKLLAYFSQIQYNKVKLKDVAIDFSADNELRIKNRYGEINLSDNSQLYNLAIISSGTTNDLKTKISWNNFREQTYCGLININTHIKETGKDSLLYEADILPSRIYIADSLWTIDPAKLTLCNGELEIQHFNASSENQKININGFLSKDKDKHLNLKFKDINLGIINNLPKNQLDLQGIMTGEATIFDPYKNVYFLSDLNISNFSLRDHLFGDISMLSKWDTTSEIIDSELKINNAGKKTLVAKGNYTPKNNTLDFIFDVDSLSLTALQPFMKGGFSDFQGEAYGNVRIYGQPTHILLNGDLYGKNASVNLNFSQVDYSFDDTVHFSNNLIIFDHITVSDPEGQTADFNGSIKHDNFKNMSYNLNFSTRRILALNTSSNDNDQFYGKLYAGGNLSITGLGLQLKLDASGHTANGTELNIMLSYDKQAKEYDFLSFVEHQPAGILGRELKINHKKNSEIEMNFNVEATPDAKVQLIYNSQVGDVIRSYGYGNLQINIDKDFNIIMYGDYTVSRGDYLFTLQNIINKKFEIANGGTIIWNGDPYDATVDIDAVYHLKASLKDLFPDSNTDINYNQRVPVNCEIALSKNLSSPTIDFDIELPSSEDRIRDEVQQFFNTEEDKNKQILSLLILGKFYTPEYIRGSYEASNSNVVGSTASELFSNQLSNWLSEISNDFDIGVNYRPGNQVTDDEVELALSTQIFNDRVTLNGNIGNNSSQETSLSNNNDIVGDFDLSVKLNRSGKLQFKAFNHSNNTLIYETSPYTQGIGISYREDYDTFKELWKKLKDLFRKKQKKDKP